MYYTKDGHELHGSTPKELLTELRYLSFSPEDSEGEFMAAVAARVATQSGAAVRTNKVENFIVDLQRAGMIYQGERANG